MGLLAFLGGYLVNSLRENIKDMGKMYSDLSTKVQSIEVMVAGAYIKKDEFERVANRIFTKLDTIEDKLDKKADKAECGTFHQRHSDNKGN